MNRSISIDPQCCGAANDLTSNNIVVAYMAKASAFGAEDMGSIPAQ